MVSLTIESVRRLRKRSGCSLAQTAEALRSCNGDEEAAYRELLSRHLLTSEPRITITQKEYDALIALRDAVKAKADQPCETDMGDNHGRSCGCWTCEARDMLRAAEARDHGE